MEQKLEKCIPVIFDCDPGIDDAVALAVAFASPALDIRAVTTVAGNVGIAHTTRNARAVLATLGVKSLIYRGAEGPLMPVPIHEAEAVHGKTGLGNYTLPEEQLHPLEKESALDGMRRILEQSPEKITIIAVGPLTNIALLLKAYPHLKEKIERISLMGGGLSTGNCSAAAEFNIICDPEAAEIVFQSGIPIIMAGLDVTHQARMSGRDMKALREIGNPVSAMLADTLAFYFGVMPDMDDPNSRDCLHDVVAVLALTRPEILRGCDLNVVVETGGCYCRGYTLADLRPANEGNELPAPNCHVLLSLQLDAFHKEILRAVGSYSEGNR